MMTSGQMGAVQLLAQLLASIPDPHDHGLSADPKSVENGVEAEIALPSGDRFLVTVTWLGDREADASAG